MLHGYFFCIGLKGHWRGISNYAVFVDCASVIAKWPFLPQENVCKPEKMQKKENDGLCYCSKILMSACCNVKDFDRVCSSLVNCLSKQALHCILKESVTQPSNFHEPFLCQSGADRENASKSTMSHWC